MQNKLKDIKKFNEKNRIWMLVLLLILSLFFLNYGIVAEKGAPNKYFSLFAGLSFIFLFLNHLTKGKSLRDKATKYYEAHPKSFEITRGLSKTFDFILLLRLTLFIIAIIIILVVTNAK